MSAKTEQCLASETLEERLSDWRNEFPERKNWLASETLP